jgi:GH24 family phage-related lysozyme (muramidase)
MQTIADARRVALISYSFWAQVLGLLAIVLPELLFDFAEIEVNPYFLWWLAVGLALFGILGRFVKQSGGFLRNFLRVLATALMILVLSWLLSASAIAGPMLVDSQQPAVAQPVVLTAGTTEAETLAVALPFIEVQEGMVLVAYRDVIGKPTICAGTTRGVVMGMRKTLAECRAIFRAELVEYRNGLHRYFTAETKRLRLTPWRDTAFLSLAINIGWAGAGKSTATRRLNAGDIAGACDAITWFNRAGGRVWRGLVTRRSAEKDLCLRGLAA